MPHATSQHLWQGDGAFPGVAREVRPAGSCGFLLTIHPPAGDYRLPAVDELSLQLCLGRPVRCRADHGVVFDARIAREDLLVSPAGTRCGYATADDGLFLMANLSRAALVAAVADERPSWSGDCGGLHAGTFRDETLAALLRRLWREASLPSQGDRLLRDALLSATAVLLAARSGVALRPAPAPRDWRLRRALEMLGDDLGGDVGLGEVAARVGVSQRHLTTLFRTHLGRTPHRWRTERRVGEARALLAGTARSVTEIALACGFASPQHLATVFKAIVGASPTQFRRDVRT